MQVTAFKSQAACASFLTVRRPGKVATRRSAAERLTRTSRTHPRSSGHASLRAGALRPGSERTIEAIFNSAIRNLPGACLDQNAGGRPLLL
jgi:hypothetical protein